MGLIWTRDTVNDSLEKKSAMDRSYVRWLTHVVCDNSVSRSTSFYDVLYNHDPSSCFECFTASKESNNYFLKPNIEMLASSKIS